MSEPEFPRGHRRRPFPGPDAPLPPDELLRLHNAKTLEPGSIPVLPGQNLRRTAYVWDRLIVPVDISPEARRNRELLRRALSGAGLTNYPGEWWHWSYGEPGWAVRTGQPHALYGAVEAQMAWEI